MVLIQPVPVGEEHCSLQGSARLLLREYAEFLRTAVSANAFDFERFEIEIDTVPMPYTDRGGEFLLAMVEGTPIGCVAYKRADANEAAGTCVIKRLFVLPESRQAGVGKRLILEVIERAVEKGFTRALLDTHLGSMAAAYKTYLELGFTEYGRIEHAADGPVVLLERMLL